MKLLLLPAFVFYCLIESSRKTDLSHHHTGIPCSLWSQVLSIDSKFTGEIIYRQLKPPSSTKQSSSRSAAYTMHPQPPPYYTSFHSNINIPDHGCFHARPREHTPETLAPGIGATFHIPARDKITLIQLLHGQPEYGPDWGCLTYVLSQSGIGKSSRDVLGVWLGSDAVNRRAQGGRHRGIDRSRQVTRCRSSCIIFRVYHSSLR